MFVNELESYTFIFTYCHVDFIIIYWFYISPFTTKEFDVKIIKLIEFISAGEKSPVSAV